MLERDPDYEFTFPQVRVIDHIQLKWFQFLSDNNLVATWCDDKKCMYLSKPKRDGTVLLQACVPLMPEIDLIVPDDED